MSPARPAVLLTAFALGAVGCGGGEGGDEATPAAPTTTAAATTELAEPFTVELHEENGSGQSGTATLIPGKVGDIDTFKVRLELDPALDATQMAHVHNVTCAEFAKVEPANQIFTIHSPLADVRDGTSESTVPGSIATGEFSINVHEPAEPYPATACGDIPKLGE